MSKIKVSIIGSTGYVGAELVHGFLNHPNVELVHLTSQTFKDKLFSDVYPVYRGLCDIKLEDITPEEVAKSKGSYTGIYIKKELDIEAKRLKVSSKKSDNK